MVALVGRRFGRIHKTFGTASAHRLGDVKSRSSDRLQTMKANQLVIILVTQLAVGAGLAHGEPNASHASGSILFQDDFSKPANSWMAAKTDYAEFAYLDSEYRILLNKPDFNTYSLLPKQTFNNCSVEADVRLVAGPSNGVFGILCRAEATE